MRRRGYLPVAALLFAVLAVAAAYCATQDRGAEPVLDTAHDVSQVQVTVMAAESVPAAPEIPEQPDEEMLIEAALLAQANVIENCRITYYCAEPYRHICGYGIGLTASGRPLVPYRSCAVDPSVIPLGSTVMVDFGDGVIHYYSADDTGSGVEGEHIDICVQGHQEALSQPYNRATVYWY